MASSLSASLLPWGNLAHIFGLNCQPHTDELQMSTQTPILSSTPSGPESTSNPTKTETSPPLQTTPHPVCYFSGKEFHPPHLGSSLIFFPSASSYKFKDPNIICPLQSGLTDMIQVHTFIFPLDSRACKGDSLLTGPWGSSLTPS